MKSLKGYLLVSDLDDTLLDSEKRISPRNLAAIRRFTEAGGIFTFVTGRVPHGLGPVLEQYVPEVPVGCLNGGGIFDVKTKEYLWQYEIDPDAAELVRLVKERCPSVGIEVCGFHYNRCEHINDVLAEHLRQEKLVCELGGFEGFGAPVAKVLMGDESHRITELEALLREHPLWEKFDFVRSAAMLYEILPKGSCKGNVMLRLADLLGISRDRIYAVGDNENDVSMLREAAVGYAVANASAGAKAAADVILRSSCEESALEELIEGLLA